MTTTITSFFTSSGTPKTGLTPVITIYRLDTNAVVVNAQNMTAVANGIYKYSFTTYDQTLEYAIYVDGGSALSTPDRYQYGSNSNEVWNSSDRSLSTSATGSLILVKATYSDNTDQYFRVKTKV
jgi:hypothetical protein